MTNSMSVFFHSMKEKYPQHPTHLTSVKTQNLEMKTSLPLGNGSSQPLNCQENWERKTGFDKPISTVFKQDQ